MANTILLKRSSVSGKVPTTGQLSSGEMALNMADAYLYFNNSGTISQVVGSSKILSNGTLTSTRPQLNFIPGSGVTISVVDNSASNRADVTITSTASGSGTVTSVNASGGTTGLSFSGGPVTTSGTLTLAGTLAVTNGGTGATTVAGAQTALQVDPAGTALALAIALG